MPQSSTIRMMARPKPVQYESFYFRGTSEDGNQAFWLKHNMVSYRGSGDVWMEGTLALFDRATGRTRVVYSQEALDRRRFSRVAQLASDWNHVALDLSNGSAVAIGPKHLSGNLVGEGGRARWDLLSRRSGLQLMPYPYEGMYRLPWPPNKIFTRDCHIDFQGSLRAGDLELSGNFHGMNGHRWGSRQAHSYGYANCAEFRGHDRSAYFDGFVARVSMVGGLLVTPHIGMASLHTGGHWHHFNHFRHILNRKVKRLDDYGWRAELRNDTHRLEIDVDGASPASLPWVALHHELANRERAVVKSTHFATLKLRLCHLDGDVEDELVSEACELETLIAGNVPATSGYVGRA